MNSSIDYDNITEWVQPFTIRETNYEAREASGGAVSRYKDSLLRGITMGPEGKPVKSEGVQSQELDLVASCVFYKEDGKKVPRDIVSSWPFRVTEDLVTRIKENSEMNDDDDTAESLQKEREMLKRME